MRNCLLPLIKSPQWAFLTNFSQHFLNYCIPSQSIIQKSGSGKMAILPFLPCSAPEIHVPLCFQTTVISEPSFETKAREMITSKYMLCPQLRLQRQSKASNEASHLRNSQSSESGPLGHCIPVCQARMRSCWGKKKNSIGDTSVSYCSKIHEDLTG